LTIVAPSRNITINNQFPVNPKAIIAIFHPSVIWSQTLLPGTTASLFFKQSAGLPGREEGSKIESPIGDLFLTRTRRMRNTSVLITANWVQMW
jgi:hypothetical protein